MRGILHEMTAFHTFVFAAYPLLIVLGANAGVLPLHWSILGRSLAVVLLGTAVLLLAMKPLIRDLAARSSFLSFTFIGFNLYAGVAGTSVNPWQAAAFAMGIAGFALAMVRPWKTRQQKTGLLNLGAIAVLVVYGYAITPAFTDREEWKPAADSLINGVAASRGPQPSGIPRDIYYVILDGFGRPDILKARYNLDLDRVVAGLQARGFDVPSRSHSNYAQTFLSIGSSLNLSYLDSVAAAAESSDRRVLDYLIQNNALMKLARRSGYRVLAIGSDYAATERLTAADSCRCQQFGLHEVEATALNLTPLRALPLDRWTYGGHRRKIEESLRSLRAMAAEPGPKLVFAHFLSPHPPFVFNQDGSFVDNGSRMYSFLDGNQYPGSHEEYAAGYGGQARFVADEVLAAIDVILARPGPKPVIVVHGDHGPGSTWELEDLRGERGRERMSIFSAYLFPQDRSEPLPDDITPVNGMRLLANRYLGTSLPMLENVSFTSTWKHPYRFEVLAAEPVATADRRR
jgi:hypothetical protein